LALVAGRRWSVEDKGRIVAESYTPGTVVSEVARRHEMALSMWRVLITMEVSFCVEALEDALARYGKPEIFNTIRVARSARRDAA
jgi:hypothetical protein